MRGVLFWAMADGADCGAQERRSQRLITAHLHSFSLIQLLPLFFFFFKMSNVLTTDFFWCFQKFLLLHVWGLPVLNLYPELIAGPGGGQITQTSGCVTILGSVRHSEQLLAKMVDPIRGRKCAGWSFLKVIFKSWLRLIPSRPVKSEDGKNIRQEGEASKSTWTSNSCLHQCSESP